MTVKVDVIHSYSKVADSDPDDIVRLLTDHNDNRKLTLSTVNSEDAGIHRSDSRMQTLPK